MREKSSDKQPKKKKPLIIVLAVALSVIAVIAVTLWATLSDKGKNQTETGGGYQTETGNENQTETGDGNQTETGGGNQTEYCAAAFDVDGGEPAPDAQTVKCGEKISAPAEPAKIGYTFDGWYLGAEKYDFDSPITDNITLTAHWTVNKYTITVASNDTAYGTVDKVFVANVPHGSTVTVNGAALTLNGETVTATPAASDGGYTYAFDGWSVANGTEITGATAITAAFTRNAKSYTVTFISRGAQISSETVPYGQKVAKPATDPEAAVNWGTMTFAYWGLGSAEYDFDTPITDDITLVAQWNSSIQLTDLKIDTAKGVKTDFTIGEEFSAANLAITAKGLNTSGAEVTLSLTVDDVEIDSSAYDKTKAGAYDIYVSYTLGEITRHATYSINVTSAITGFHGIEIVKATTEYVVAAAGEPPAAIPVDDITVYSVNENGSRGKELSEYTLTYYVADTEIRESEMTDESEKVFQIWATVIYTKGAETYEMSDFVLVYVNAKTEGNA